MTKQEAIKFMNQQFESFVSKAQNAKTDDEEIKFTNEAHRLFVTMIQANIFEEENHSPILGN